MHILHFQRRWVEKNMSLENRPKPYKHTHIFGRSNAINRNYKSYTITWNTASECITVTISHHHFPDVCTHTCLFSAPQVEGVPGRVLANMYLYSVTQHRGGSLCMYRGRGGGGAGGVGVQEQGKERGWQRQGHEDK